VEIDPAALRDRLRALLPSVRCDLESLVRIPSVSLLPDHAAVRLPPCMTDCWHA